MIVLTKLNSDFIFTIQDLKLYIIFYPREIKIFDLHTKELLLQEELTEDYDIIEQDSDKKYSYYLMKGENFVYNIIFSLLREVQKIKTDAGYILNVGRSLSKGFYAGLYEFGSFIFDNKTIQLEKRIAHENLSYGLLHEKSNLFYICRSSKGIECWDWSKKQPSLKWVKNEITVLKGLAVAPNNIIFVGTNDGTIYTLDEAGKVLKELSFEKEPIRHMIITDGVICLTNNEYVYKLPIDNEENIIWKTKLPSKGPNHSLSYIDNEIWITTYLGQLIVIDNEYGNINAIHDIVKENFSPVTILQEKWIIYTSPEQLNCKILDEDKNDEYTIMFKDKMIRALVPITNGVIVGDDYGDLTLLKRPGIEIRKLANVKKLMQFDPTK